MNGNGGPKILIQQWYVLSRIDERRSCRVLILLKVRRGIRGEKGVQIAHTLLLTTQEN
jgi:hypothetical protein